MTSLEKQTQVKDVLYHMCAYGEGCSECRFFNPEDITDGDYFCYMRDYNGYIPTSEDWHMGSAMISGMANERGAGDKQ